MVGSARWGYVRIITGTILGGVLGFYVMHRVEKSYKEKMNERLLQYEAQRRRNLENNDNPHDIAETLPDS